MSSTTITFAVSGSLSLLSPLPAISDSVTINGPGSGLLTIRGGSSGLTSPLGTLTVDGTDGLTIQVSGLTVSGNHGSGLYLSGADVFTLNDVAVIGNSTSGVGGGILISGGSLTMQSCTVASNTAGGFLGGGYLRVLGCKCHAGKHVRRRQ